MTPGLPDGGLSLAVLVVLAVVLIASFLIAGYRIAIWVQMDPALGALIGLTIGVVALLAWLLPGQFPFSLVDALAAPIDSVDARPEGVLRDHVAATQPAESALLRP